MEADEKACQFCAETIKAAAIVCKHCGRDLPTLQGGDRNPIADLPTHTQSRVRSLGIAWHQGRWVVDGCYFTELSRAIEFCERPKTPPLQSVAKKPKGPLFWLIAFLSAGVVLFVGSAVISGFAGGNSFGDRVEQICREDAARAGVIMDCKAIRRIAEERDLKQKEGCPPEAPGCSWGR